jgi:hypothetical protein
VYVESMILSVALLPYLGDLVIRRSPVPDQSSSPRLEQSDCAIREPSSDQRLARVSGHHLDCHAQKAGRSPGVQVGVGMAVQETQGAVHQARYNVSRPEDGFHCHHGCLSSCELVKCFPGFWLPKLFWTGSTTRTRMLDIRFNTHVRVSNKK